MPQRSKDDYEGRHHKSPESASPIVFVEIRPNRRQLVWKDGKPRGRILWGWEREEMMSKIAPWGRESWPPPSCLTSSCKQSHTHVRTNSTYCGRWRWLRYYHRSHGSNFFIYILLHSGASAQMCYFVFFLKFWLPIGLHNTSRCSISPTDAPECRWGERGNDLFNSTLCLGGQHHLLSTWL